MKVAGYRAEDLALGTLSGSRRPDEKTTGMSPHREQISIVMEGICRVRKRSAPRALTASARMPQAAGGRRHLSKIEDEPGSRLPALNLVESFVNFLESPHVTFHLCSPGGMQFERLGQIYAIPND